MTGAMFSLPIPSWVIWVPFTLMWVQFFFLIRELKRSGFFRVLARAFVEMYK